MFTSNKHIREFRMNYSNCNALGGIDMQKSILMKMKSAVALGLITATLLSTSASPTFAQIGVDTPSTENEMVITAVPISAYLGFKDITGNLYEADIMTLYEKEIIKGVGNSLFDPMGQLTYAQMIQVFVNFFDLNLDTIRFFKEPLATDYFIMADNDAWYANALITGAVNGINLPYDIDLNTAVTKETFIATLVGMMEAKYDLPLIKIMPVVISDEADLDISNLGFIQRNLVYGISLLDKDQAFHPQMILTRDVMASYVNGALKYLQEHDLIRNEAKLYDVFGATLQKTVTPSGVNLDFKLSNASSASYDIEYGSGQEFDVIVEDVQGNEVYRWSNGKAFIMMMVTKTIQANEVMDYSLLWNEVDNDGNKLPKDTYTIRFETSFYYNGLTFSFEDSVEHIIQ